MVHSIYTLQDYLHLVQKCQVPVDIIVTTVIFSDRSNNLTDRTDTVTSFFEVLSLPATAAEN